MGKYLNRARTKLEQRIQSYNDSLKRVKAPQGYRKPGSQNPKKH